MTEALNITNTGLLLQTNRELLDHEKKTENEVAKEKKAENAKAKQANEGNQYDNRTKALLAVAQALILMEETMAKSHAQVQKEQQKMGAEQIKQANKNYKKVVKATKKLVHARHESHGFFHSLFSSISHLLSDISKLLKEIPGVNQINNAANAGINATAGAMHKMTGMNTELCKGLVKIAIIAAATGGTGAAEEGAAAEGGAAVAGAAEAEQGAAVSAGVRSTLTSYGVRSALIVTMDPTTDLLVGGLKQMGVHDKMTLEIAGAIAQIINMVIAGYYAPEAMKSSKAMQAFMALGGITGGVTSVWNGKIALDQSKATKEYAKAMKHFTLSEELSKLFRGYAETEQKQTLDMFKGFRQMNRSFGSFFRIDQTIARIRA